MTDVPLRFTPDLIARRFDFNPDITLEANWSSWKWGHPFRNVHQGLWRVEFPALTMRLNTVLDNRGLEVKRNTLFTLTFTDKETYRRILSDKERNDLYRRDLVLSFRNETPREYRCNFNVGNDSYAVVAVVDGWNIPWYHWPRIWIWLQTPRVVRRILVYGLSGDTWLQKYHPSSKLSNSSFRIAIVSLALAHLYMN